MNTKTKLTYLENVLTLWQNQFDEKPSMENISVHINERGMIVISGHEVCSADALSIEEYDIEYEYFNLLLTNGDYIRVEILWAYDQSPVVSAICLHQIIFSLDE